MHQFLNCNFTYIVILASPYFTTLSVQIGPIWTQFVPLPFRKYEGRTTRDITTTEPLWEILDSWAQQTGYQLVGQDEVSRLYQRGADLAAHVGMPPQMLQVAWTGDHYKLEAWVRHPQSSQLRGGGLVTEELEKRPGTK
jgi:hypothetical protein